MYFVPDEGYPESMQMLRFNPDSLPTFPSSQNCLNGNYQNGYFQNYDYVDDPTSLTDPNYNTTYQTPYLNEDITQVPDFPDACLKFINDILMEEELDDRPTTLEDYNALQATEKSLYDALVESYTHSSNQWSMSVGQSTEHPYDIESQWGNNSFYAVSENVIEPNWLIDQTHLGYCQPDEYTRHQVESISQSSASSSFDHGLADSPVSILLANDISSLPNCNPKANPRKNHERESRDQMEERRSKQSAADNYEEYVEMEKFDDVLICKEGNDDISPCTTKTAVHEADDDSQKKGNSKRSSKSKSKSSRGKKSNNREVVDLRTLLTQCAQAVASFELTNANELLKQVRQHASPFGDSTQRVAHYFANGLEARLAGTGSDLYKDLVGKRISSVDILKGYKLYVSAIPFQRTSYFLANQTIAKLAEKATRVHIIDFGIFFGFQWPCLIQNLSKRPLGPPRLKITGVDYPKSGFKPAQKVEETGRRLRGYCERFGVPFEFHAIAQRWHTIKPEDIKIEKDELVIVTCLYQSRKLPDESVDVNCPRDGFLKMIRSLNPDLFIHGVVNGTFNAPFFITRFREALYHYSCLFDVYEATIPREDNERLLIETYLYGKDALNIVACEGSERVERPETYKQWQVRKNRAGFKQVSLDQEIVNRARAMVKANYHKDFMVEQDRHWMVQGWKGRILSAISCWKPA